MSTRSRTYGQLLLFAVLLFGIVTMHTLGHPSAHGPAEGPGHATYAMAHTDRHAAPASVSAEMPPMTGMDPLSVCLAVLGGFTLVLLLALALSGPWASGAARPTLPHALWPEPPPPRTLLSRLSVLRI
ncbi:DUF6153 family protein [Streptomyces sp. NPDC058476]|uniref:DUF6153 family protein n=1 Tax=Streptomyces sp. NPDC058476 TaxID=3346519 RepID=UPI003646F3EE